VAVVALGARVDGGQGDADRSGPAGPGGLRWRLARLEDQNAGLCQAQQRLEAECERLGGENQRLRGRA